MKDFVIVANLPANAKAAGRVMADWLTIESKKRWKVILASVRSDRVDNEIGDQYSFLFAATTLFGSGACGALSQLNPDAE